MLGTMHWRVVVTIAVGSLSSAIPAHAEHLRKVAAYMDPAPGESGNFRIFGTLNGFSPAIDGNNVAFGAGTDGGAGIYAYIDGQLRLVADTNTVAPGTKSTFGFGLTWGSGPDISGRNVVFGAIVPGIGGSIWLWRDGELIKIADPNTPVPGSPGETFRSFPIGAGMSPAISGENIAFTAVLEKGSGVYALINGELRLIADTNTPLPGATHLPTTFGSLTGVSADISGENVVFFAHWAPDGDGIYANIDGLLRVIVAPGTPLPLGSDPFCGTSFSGAFALNGVSPSISGSNVAFVTVCGVYAYINGQVRLVADFGTSSPSGVGSMGNFLGGGSGPSIDGEHVAFLAGATGIGFGVFAYFNECVRAIAGQNTAVPESPFNNTFSSFGIASGVGPDISGRNIVFHGFPTSGIYVGNVDALPVSLRDVAILQRCFGGSGEAVTEPCCRRFDTDSDNDVDLDDYRAFRSTLTDPE